MSSPHLGEWIALETDFDAVRRSLDGLDSPVREHYLAQFLRASDPCVPAQTLKLTVAAISAMSFEELKTLPGVGLVKVRNLIGLLHRIDAESRGIALESSSALPENAAIAPTTVPQTANEIEWDRWCTRIRAHYLEDQYLGRVVDRLSDLPRTLWHAPLRDYVNLPLEAIRELPAHGPRRIELIVETVRKLSELADATDAVPGAALTIGPERMATADALMIDAVLGRRTLACGSLWGEVLHPLVEQLRHDLGDATAELVRTRMAAQCPPPADKSMNAVPWSERLSSSRVQQLLHDAATAVGVRWPRGADAATALVNRAAGDGDTEHAQRLRATLGVVFPKLRAVRTTSTVSATRMIHA